MATRKQIALKAAKLAAQATYKSVMNAPVTKTAASTKGVKVKVDAKGVAKSAAKAVYTAILKSAQAESIPVQIQPNDSAGLSAALVAAGAPLIDAVINGKELTSMEEINQVKGEWPNVQSAPSISDPAKNQIHQQISGILNYAG